MDRHNDIHTRIVTIAKFVLPLLSLSVLATLFLFWRGQSYDLDIPYARVDLETLAREQRLDGPNFATLMDDGAELSIKAARVRPDLSGGDVINSSLFVGKVNYPDDSTISFSAPDAILDGRARLIELAGGVNLESSNGFKVATEGLAALIDTSRLETSGEVLAKGPLGELSAGRLVIELDGETEMYVLTFNDGVKLVYNPPH